MFILNGSSKNLETGSGWFRVRWNGYDLLLSAAFALASVLMTRVQFSGTVSATVQENYFTDFGPSAVLLFLFLLAAFYLLIPVLDSMMHKGIQWLSAQKEEGEKPARALIFWGILIFAAWLPYYLSYYPGGIYSDTFNSITYALTDTLCNRHPLFYNFLIGLAIKFGELFGKDLEWSMGLFLAVQMILIEIELLYFLSWMIRHRIMRRMRICVMAFMTFFTLIPLYAISVWKDTPFAMAFLLWFFFAVDLFLEVKKGMWRFKSLAGFVAGMFLVAFTRNNGIYVTAFAAVSFVFFTITFRFDFESSPYAFSVCGKKIGIPAGLVKKIMTYGVLLSSVFVIACIQGPVYRRVGVIPTDVVEDIGMPIQQICSVVVHDGEITEAQRESINRFIPYENIPEYFKPCVVDSIKWYADMDWGYLELHKAEFWDLWKHLFLQNPGIYMEEYLLQTLGFWNVGVSGSNGYAEVEVWSNDYGLVQTDYFEKIFGFSFQQFVNPKIYISCAWFFWFFFVGTVFIMKRYGFWNGFLFMPQIGVWLTLMVATPIAISLRYVSPLLFTLPFVVIVPVLLEKDQTRQ